MITKDTVATGNTPRFADTAVFSPSIWTAAISSETEAEREREREKQTEREGGAVRQRGEFKSRAC